MIEKYFSGSEIVFGIRNRRKWEPIIKKVTGKDFEKRTGNLKSDNILELEGLIKMNEQFNNFKFKEIQ